MKTILHKANTRGFADHGWLKSYHTFSFANYFNPDRVNFGALRVLNDDTIDGGTGFGMHPHDNMEIISIPIEGELEHKDSMGNTCVIKSGEIQVMSAGTGILHSEYNKNKDSVAKFLQIWIFTNKHNTEPSYSQISFDIKAKHNNLQQIVSPNPDDKCGVINQNAWFHIGKLDSNFVTEYQLKDPNNGVYAFVISGDITINDINLSNRDGLGIWDTDKLYIKADSDTEILLMEVPMKY